jgi:hypothetical protein
MPPDKGLEASTPGGMFTATKVLSMEEAQARFAAVYQEALAGEVIRLPVSDGALLQLTPVPAVSASSALSNGKLAECYDDV